MADWLSIPSSIGSAALPTEKVATTGVPVAAEECHQHTETEEDHDIHVAEIAVLAAQIIGQVHLHEKSKGTKSQRL